MKRKHLFIFRKGTLWLQWDTGKMAFSAAKLVGGISRENCENVAFQMRWKMFGIKVPCTIEN